MDKYSKAFNQDYETYMSMYWMGGESHCQRRRRATGIKEGLMDCLLINSLILMPAMGIGNALATIVGQNLGANNVARAKEAVRTSVIIATLVLVVGGSIIFMTAENIIGIFTDDAEVLSQGTYYLRLITASIPLMGFFQIFVGTFQGSGHTIMAMTIMMGRLWALRIPLILVFKTYTNLDTNSVWYAMILSNAIICIVGLGLYMTGRWQKQIIKKRAIE